MENVMQLLIRIDMRYVLPFWIASLIMQFVAIETNQRELAMLYRKMSDFANIFYIILVGIIFILDLTE